MINHYIPSWRLAGNGWEWGLLWLSLITIVDHSLIPYVNSTSKIHYSEAIEPFWTPPQVLPVPGEVIVMGGAYGERRGNRTPSAEANFFDGPEAAQAPKNMGGFRGGTPKMDDLS